MDMVYDLKFSEYLPLEPAAEMLERRLQEPESTRRVLERHVRFVVQRSSIIAHRLRKFRSQVSVACYTYGWLTSRFRTWQNANWQSRRTGAGRGGGRIGVFPMPTNRPSPHFSIKDEKSMAHTLEAIDRLLNEGRTVYIHCWGGVGRTGTVVACWMLRRGMATAGEVLSKLSALRRQDKERGNRQSPETSPQRDFILAWGRLQAQTCPPVTNPVANASDGFQPTPAAAATLRELVDRYNFMDGFADGPCGKNRLTATESALFAATYEIRRLLGSVDSDEHRGRLGV